MGRRRIWTLERCKAEAGRFNRRIDWARGSTSSYFVAVKNGWLTDCAAHMLEPRGRRKIWTPERCQEDALKYSCRSDWHRYGGSSYQAARTMGIFEQCAAHMGAPKNRKKWTKETCRKEALDYSSRKQWEDGSPASYQAAKRNGWIEECVSHMGTPLNTKRWTKEAILEEAKKYSGCYEM